MSRVIRLNPWNTKKNGTMSRALIWLDLSSDEFFAFQFCILVIGDCDERLLRRWINLIFVGWLPQLMIRRGAGFILQNERRSNSSRNSCGSRARQAFPWLAVRHDSPSFQIPIRANSALVCQLSPIFSPSTFHGSLHNLIAHRSRKPRFVSTPAKPKAGLA